MAHSTPEQADVGMMRFATALAIILTACGGGDLWVSTGPSGNFELMAIDGAPTPVTINEDGELRMLLEASLAVAGENWLIDQRTTLILKATGDTVGANTDQMAFGIWRGSDSGDLTFTGRGEGATPFSGPGAFDETNGILRLTVSGSALGSVFEFRKR
jgi:hypothetical protein